MSGKHVVAERNCVTGQKKTDAFLFTTLLLLQFEYLTTTPLPLDVKRQKEREKKLETIKLHVACSFAGTWLSGLKCEKLTASDEGQRTRKKLDRRRRRFILVLTTDYKYQYTSITNRSELTTATNRCAAEKLPKKCRLAEVAAITAKPKMRVPKMKTQEMIPFAIASP
ncbi:hypothetical protein T09_12636 [Trichinella sp. T9]|nr:hypothetical protein T09_12636 [Trichinella sp. T9]